MESLPSFRGFTLTSPEFNAVQRDYKDYSAGNVWTTTRSFTASPTPSLYGDRNWYNMGAPNQYHTNCPSLDYVAGKFHGSAANPRDDYGFHVSSRANSPNSSYTRAGFPPPPRRQQRRPSLPVLDPYSDLVSSCASQLDTDITSYEDELEPDQSVSEAKQYRDPTSKDLDRQDSVDGGSGARAASAALLDRSRTPRPESPLSDEDGSDPDQQPTFRQRYSPPPQGYSQYPLQHHPLQIPKDGPTSPPFAPSPLQKQERQGSEQRDTNTTGSPSFDTSIEDGSETDLSLKGGNQNRNPESRKTEDLNRQDNVDGSGACAASSAPPSRASQKVL